MSGGISIHVEGGKIVVGERADSRIIESVGQQNAEAVSSRARMNLTDQTKEFTGGQVGPIMCRPRQETAKWQAGDNLDHQRRGAGPEERESAEAMADTDKFDAENEIA